MPEAGVSGTARRNLLQSALLLIGGALPAWTQARQERPKASAWVAWDDFARQFMQADGRIVPEPLMDVDHVGRAVAQMAALPLESNIQFMTIMATKMPFIGRG